MRGILCYTCLVPNVGDITVYPCPLGHHCVNASTVPAPCPVGTYRWDMRGILCYTYPVLGLYTVYPCPSGHHCVNASTVPAPCPVGTYRWDIRGILCFTCPVLGTTLFTLAHWATIVLMPVLCQLLALLAPRGELWDGFYVILAQCWGLHSLPLPIGPPLCECQYCAGSLPCWHLQVRYERDFMFYLPGVGDYTVYPCPLGHHCLNVSTVPPHCSVEWLTGALSHSMPVTC